MKDKIVDIEGKKFLMNFSDNSFLEIVDYNEPKINTLTPFSYICLLYTSPSPRDTR